MVPGHSIYELHSRSISWTKMLVGATTLGQVNVFNTITLSPDDNVLHHHLYLSGPTVCVEISQLSWAHLSLLPYTFTWAHLRWPVYHPEGVEHNVLNFRFELHVANLSIFLGIYIRLTHLLLTRVFSLSLLLPLGWSGSVHSLTIVYDN
jgi:hypothetical protein